MANWYDDPNALPLESEATLPATVNPNPLLSAYQRGLAGLNPDGTPVAPSPALPSALPQYAGTPGVLQGLNQYLAQKPKPLSPEAQAKANAWLKSQAAKQQPEKEKEFFDLSNTAGALWDAAKGLGTTVPAAYHQLKEGTTRPDQWSPEAKAALAEQEVYRQAMEEKTRAAQAAGDSDSVSESIREAGGSLGFSLGAMGAALPAGWAGAKAGAALGAVTPLPGGATAGGLIGGFAGAMAGSGAGAYRMAYADFMGEAFKKLEEKSLKNNQRPMTEAEKAQAYAELSPVAENTALWEAGPEAVGNAATLGAGGLVFGWLGKEGLKKIASSTAKRVGLKTAALAGGVGTEVLTEGVTQFNQGNDQAKLRAYLEGLPMDQAQPEYEGIAGFGQAIADVAPQTLALVGMMGGAAGGVKVVGKAYDRYVQDPKRADALLEVASNADVRKALPNDALANLDIVGEQLVKRFPNNESLAQSLGTIREELLGRTREAPEVAKTRQQLLDTLYQANPNLQGLFGKTEAGAPQGGADVRGLQQVAPKLGALGLDLRKLDNDLYMEKMATDAAQGQLNQEQSDFLKSLQDAGLLGATETVTPEEIITAFAQGRAAVRTPAAPIDELEELGFGPPSPSGTPSALPTPPARQGIADPQALGRQMLEEALARRQAEQALSTPPTPIESTPPLTPTPGETIQLQRGESIELTPPKPGEPVTRTTATPEEQARLQGFMGERPARAAPVVEPPGLSSIPKAAPPPPVKIGNQEVAPVAEGTLQGLDLLREQARQVAQRNTPADRAADLLSQIPGKIGEQQRIAQERLKPRTPVEATPEATPIPLIPTPTQEAPSAQPSKKPVWEGKSKEELESSLQMYDDAFEIKKRKKEEIPQEWIDNYGAIKQVLRGEEPQEGLSPLIVPGHPEHPLTNTSPLFRYGTVPLKVTSLEQVNKRLSEANEAVSSASESYYSAKYQLDSAKTAAEKKKANQAIQDLANQGITEDAILAFRNETIPELNRLYREMKKRTPSPTGVDSNAQEVQAQTEAPLNQGAPAAEVAGKVAQAPVPKKEPWQMTREQYFDEEAGSRVVRDIQQKYGRIEPQALVSYDYLDPGPAGPLNGKISIKPGTHKKGDVIQATFGRAVVKSVGRATTNNDDELKENRFELAKQLHKDAVQQAISEGKSVPPEVLADYPDLAKQAEVAPTPATTSTPVNRTPEADPFAPTTPEERQATQRREKLADPDFKKAMIEYRDRIGWAVVGERLFADGKYIGSTSYVPHPDNPWWAESKGLRQAKGLSEAKVRAALTKFSQGEAPESAGETALLDFLIDYEQYRQSMQQESAWIEDQLTTEEADLLNRLTAELKNHPDFGSDRLAEFLQEVSRKYQTLTPAQFGRALILTYKAKLDALRKAQPTERTERATEGSPSPAGESTGTPTGEPPLLTDYTLAELDAENADAQRKIEEAEAQKDQAYTESLREKEQKALIQDKLNRFAPAGMDELFQPDDLLAGAKEAPKADTVDLAEKAASRFPKDGTPAEKIAYLKTVPENARNDEYRRAVNDAMLEQLNLDLPEGWKAWHSTETRTFILEDPNGTSGRIVKGQFLKPETAVRWLELAKATPANPKATTPEKSNDPNVNQSDSETTLEGDVPGSGAADAATQRPGERSPSGSGTDVEGDGRLGSDRDDDAGSLAGKPDAVGVQEPAAGLDAARDNDLDALWNSLVDEELGTPAPAKTPKTSAPRPRKQAEPKTPSTQRQVKEKAAHAVSELAKAADQATDGLLNLFFTPGKLGANLSVDAEQYERAKPMFLAAARHLKNAAADIAAILRLIIQDIVRKGKAAGMDDAAIRQGLERIAPYAKRFAKDVEEGAITLDLAAIPENPTQPKGAALIGQNPGNYRITDTDRLGQGSDNVKVEQNIAAIRLVQQLEAENRYATREEQAVLAKYVGWGGLKGAFAPNGEQQSKWNAQLKALVAEGVWTQREYNSAWESTADAHYTSKPVIDAMYRFLGHMGFTGGRVLEPTVGVGNFIGLMPEAVAQQSQWFASEIDTITSAIAKHLYPDAQIKTATPFEEAEFPYGRFDLAIGNPPFGSLRITENKAQRKALDGWKIHNYVIGKSAMHLRQGGVMAMVVTHRFLDTMDSSSQQTREWLDQNMWFLGAVRLPNTAFKKNAGTEVVTDIVFFMRPDMSLIGKVTPVKNWTSLGSVMHNGQPVPVNQYFADNPQLMFGQPTMEGSMYGDKQEFTLKDTGVDIPAAFDQALQTDFAGLANILKEVKAHQQDAPAFFMENREDISVGGYILENDKLYLREDNDQDGNITFTELSPDTQWTAKQTLGQARYDRLKGLLQLRGMAYALIAAEQQDAPNMETLRATLRQRYQTFVKAFGPIGSSANARLLEDDPKIEFGLEKNFRKAIAATRAKKLGIATREDSAEMADILTKRVYYPYKGVTSAKDAIDGFQVSLSEKGRLDLDYIAELTTLNVTDVVDQLSMGDAPRIFHDPTTHQWVAVDEYLSGNVKKKLQEAQQAGLQANIRALEAVIPTDIKIDEIHVELGAPWVPARVYNDFLELLGVQKPSVLISSGGQLLLPNADSVAMTSNQFNADLQNNDMTVSEMFLNLANKQALLAYDQIIDENGNKKRVVNPERTKILQPLGKSITKMFADWVRVDPDRAALLEKEYNEKINTTVDREFDGKLLRTKDDAIVGGNPLIKLRPNQKRAAWRMIVSDNVLMDHVVGAGKTLSIIAGVMERRRTGLSKKPLVVVPNHLVGQWTKDFLELYPGARLLAANEKDFAPANRKKLMARMATGDYDAIIIGHSMLPKMPVNAETRTEFVENEIAFLVKIRQEMEAAGENKRKISGINKRIDGMRQKLREAIAKDTKDQVVFFEDTGIDYLVVDESHEFKNLMYHTNMTPVVGMGDPKGANKSFDLYMKTGSLRRRNGGITFATGTPISNSLVEMYTILRYLNPQGLAERNLESFDAWLKTFAGIEEVTEYTATGQLKARNVLTSFSGVPELLQLYRQFADTVTMEDLKRLYTEAVKANNQATGATEREDFPIPQVMGGGRQLVTVPISPAQRMYVDYLTLRAKKLEGMTGKERKEYAATDNPLWIYSDARKAALDIRVVDPTALDEGDSKVNRAVEQIKRIYDRTTDVKGTQLVFSDLSTPKKTADKEAKAFIKEALKVLDAQFNPDVESYVESLPTYREKWNELQSRMQKDMETADAINMDDYREKLEDYLSKVGDEQLSAITTADTGFSVYDDIREKLVKLGVPENEIAFVHEYNSKAEKTELFERVNAGEVRVLLGSTAKMGAGTNVQERAVALHHLDAPWRPSDMEQREGRIIRQKNKLYLQNPDGFMVEIYAYSTENTFDAVMWQILSRKAGALEQFRQGKRVVEEVNKDSASYADFMAETTGNPIFREKFEVQRKVDELDSQYNRTRMQVQSSTDFLARVEQRVAIENKLIQDAQETAQKLPTSGSLTVTLGKDAPIPLDVDAILEDETNKYQEELRQYHSDVEIYQKKGQDFLRFLRTLPVEARRKLTEAYNGAPVEDAKWQSLLNDYLQVIAKQGPNHLYDKVISKGIIPEIQELGKPPKIEIPLDEPKKPVYPELDSARVRKRIPFLKELREKLYALRYETFSLDINGIQIEIEKSAADKTKNEFAVSMDGREIHRYASENAVLGNLQASQLKSRLEHAVKESQRTLTRLEDERVKSEVLLKKANLDRMKAQLDSLKARYEEIIRLVNQAEADLAQERKGKVNPYVERDSSRNLTEPEDADTGAQIEVDGTAVPENLAQKSRTTTPAPGLSRPGFVAALQRRFPHLSEALNAMLARGEKNQKGGLVLINSNDLDAIAKVFAEKTGRSLESARQEIQASRRRATAFNANQSAFDLSSEAQVRNPVTLMTDNASSVAPIQESDEARKYRESVGYARIIRVNAAALQAEFEQQNNEKLVHKPLRVEKLREYATWDAHPLVGITPYINRLSITDGRHRIAVAAERGQEIDIAVPEDRAAALQAIFGTASNRDTEYLAAVERGDLETAQRMVTEAAEAAGVPVISEEGVTAYKVRRNAPPKKTVKAYKLFRVKSNQKGEVFALFVGANDPLPQDVWLDAIAGPGAGTNKSGGPMVKSKLGPLSFRPGWHAGDIPLATHIGAKQSKSSPIMGRKEDEVWAEVDVAADDDGRYQKEADKNGTRPDGRFVVGDADIKYMPENGMYRYKTNPNMTGQWIISGSMKINRILSENEVNELIREAGLGTMPWTINTGAKVNPYQEAPLDLARWGLGTNPAVNQKKLLDPVTYDDAGNVIPLSQRFDKTKQDVRFSKDGVIQGIYDPQTGITFAILPNLSEASAPGVFLHENVHAQQRADIDARAVELVNSRERVKRPELRTLLNRVQARLEASSATNDPKEVSAYLIEELAATARLNGMGAADGKFLDWVDRTLGQSVGNWVRSIVKALRGWAFRHGFLLKASQLSLDDLLAWAETGVQRTAAGDVRVTNAIVAYSNKSDEELRTLAIRNIQEGVWAFNKAMDSKTTVHSAVYRPELGWIDFDYGKPGIPEKNYKRGFGLSHLLARRGVVEGRDLQQFGRDLINTLALGTAGDIYGYPGDPRVNIQLNDMVATVSMKFFGGQRVWLLTAFYDKNADVAGRDVDLLGTTQAEPYFTRLDLGAALSTRLTLPDELGKLVDEIGISHFRNSLRVAEQQNKSQTPVMKGQPLFSRTLTADELLAQVQSGQVDSLTPDQWAQVQQAFLQQSTEAIAPTGTQAPSFKTWFGASRIKSKTGQPLAMYHATDAEFSVFDPAQSGQSTTHPTAALGFFFTNDRDHAAAQYGNNVMEVYLAIENPYPMTDADLRKIDTLEDAKAFRQRLEAQGYDGIVMPAETRTRYVAAFHADQIKRTDNQTYTKGEKDIRFSKVQESTADFKRWSRGYSVVEDAATDNRVKNLGDWTFEEVKGAEYWKAWTWKKKGAAKNAFTVLSTDAGLTWNIHASMPAYLKATDRKFGFESIEEAKEAVEKLANRAFDSNMGYIETYGETSGERDFQTGKPFVAKVYHGAKTGGIEEFETTRLGSNTGAASAKKGFFFSGSPSTANSTYYTGEVPGEGGTGSPKVYKFLKKLEKGDFGDVAIEGDIEGERVVIIGSEVFEEQGDWGESDLIDSESKVDALSLVFEQGGLPNAINYYEAQYGGSPTVYPAYVRMANPMVYDQKGEEYREESYNTILAKAKAAGHDGVVITNTYDGGPLDNIFVVFDNKDIKGYYNRGTFDDTGRLSYSRATSTTSIVSASAITQSLIQPKLAAWNEAGLSVEVVQSAADLPADLRARLPDDSVEGFYETQTGKVYLIADQLSSMDRAKEVLSHEVIGHWASHNLRAAPEFVQILKALNRLEAVGNKDIVAIAAQVDAAQPGLDRFDRAEEIYSVAIERGLHEKIGLLRTWSLKLLQRVKAWLRKLGFEGRFVNDITLNDVLLWAQESQRRLDQGGRGTDGKWAFTGSRGISTSFAGEKAQTADLSLLQQAKLRVEQGEDAETVRKETGWFKGLDNRWKFEIDDSKINLADGYGDLFEKKTKQSTTLDGFISHPDLFDAYPDLRNIKVILASRTKLGEASYNPESKTITLGVDVTNKNKNQYVYEEVLKSIIHEVQHAIQSIEGFAIGTSPEKTEITAEDVRKIGAELSVSILGLERNKYRELNQYLRDLGHRYQPTLLNSGTVSETSMDMVDGIILFASEQGMLNIVETAERWEGAALNSKRSPEEQKAIEKKAFKDYLSNAGEIEARATTDRLNWNIKHRQLYKPYEDTQFRDGIADEDVIVRFEGGTADLRYSRALPASQYEDTQGVVQDSQAINPTGGELKEQRKIIQRLREDGFWKTIKTVTKETRPAWLKLLTLQQKVEMLQDIQALKDLATLFENTALAMDADKSNLKQEAFALAEEMRSEMVKARDKGYLLGRILQWSSLKNVVPYQAPERIFFATTAEFVEATENYQRLMEMVKKLETDHPALLALYDKIMGKGTVDANGQHQPNMIERMDGLYRTALQERLGRQALMFLNSTLESAQDSRAQTLWQQLHGLAQRDPAAFTDLQQTYQAFLAVTEPTSAQLAAWRDSLPPDSAVLWEELLIRDGRMRNRRSQQMIRDMLAAATNPAKTPRSGTLTAALRTLHNQDVNAYNELRDALKLRLDFYRPTDDRHAEIKNRLPHSVQALFEQITTANNAAVAKVSLNNKLEATKTTAPAQEKSLTGRLHTLFLQSPERFAELSKALRTRLQTPEMEAAEVDALRSRLLEPADQALFDELAADMRAKVQPGLTALRELYESRRQSGPYFPLDRFGPYQVYAERAGNGKDGIGLPAFSTFETEAEQQRAVQRMQAEGWTVRTNYQIRDALETAAPPNSFIKKMFNQIDQTEMLEAERQTLKNDIYQMYLQSLPELSARKHFMKRKGIPGFSGDALRSFAQLMNSKANAIARLRHSDQLTNALESMEKASKAMGQDPTKLADQNRARMIVEELKDSYSWMMNPSNATWANRLTSLGFFWYLTNISTALVNLTQVPIWTFPELGAKFGAGRSFAALNKTIAEYGVWKLRRGETGRKMLERMRGEFNGELGLDLDRIERDGIVTRTQAVTLAGMGEDAPEFKGGAAGSASAGWKWVFDRVSWPFHKTEVANREISFITAYRLARASEQAQAIVEKMTAGGSAPDAINDAVRNYAYETARNVVLKTQGNYANYNRAPFMRSNIMRVVTLFRSYSQMMTWRLLRDTYQAFKSANPQEKAEVKKRLGLMLASSFLWGGAMGLPIYTIAMSLAGLLFGNDPDDPYEPEVAMKQALQGLLGETGQQVLMGGVVGQLPKMANLIPGIDGVTGIDLAPRVSADLVRLWMRRMPGDLEGESAWDWYVMQAMGPIAGMGRNAFRAYGDLMNSAQGGGSLFRALEGTMPAPIRNILKAARFEEEGVTTRRGDLLVPDMNWAMVVQQAVGFTPDTVAAQYVQNTARYEFKDALQKRRKGLTDRYIFSLHEKDDELRKETLEFVKKFNRLNPETPITAQTLKSAYGQWLRARQLSEGGVYEPSKGMRARLKREFAEEESEE